jgi:hypothetical protein
MSIASGYSGFNEGQSSLRPREMAHLFRKAFRNDPDLAESLTRPPFTLPATRSGPDGIAQPSNTLIDGIEWAYSIPAPTDLR